MLRDADAHCPLRLNPQCRRRDDMTLSPPACNVRKGSVGGNEWVSRACGGDGSDDGDSSLSLLNRTPLPADRFLPAPLRDTDRLG